MAADRTRRKGADHNESEGKALINPSGQPKTLAFGLEAIAINWVEAIASRLEAIATRVEAITTNSYIEAIGLEAIAVAIPSARLASIGSLLTLTLVLHWRVLGF